MKTLKYSILILVTSIFTSTIIHAKNHLTDPIKTPAHHTLSDQRQGHIMSDTLQNRTEATEATATVFSFTHKYVMQIERGNRKVDMMYYLAPSGDYFATAVDSNNPDKSTISVMDLSNKKIHTLMNNDGDKTRISLPLNLKKAANSMIDLTSVDITPTGTTKTILGYNCNGYKVEGETVKGTVWVTQDAGISFAKHIYKTDADVRQDEIFTKLLTGLTLEMDMIDTSRRRPKSILMKCISLEEDHMTINLDDYRKLM